VVFVEKRDYEYYLANLRTFKRASGCRVYGFCLLTNHVHLIIDPGSDAASNPAAAADRERHTRQT